MTQLFVNVLKTSLSGGIIILLILLLRLVFRKTPKALFCLLWTVAILRLLLPFHIEVNWSLRPSSAVLTDRIESFHVSPASGAIIGEDNSLLVYRSSPTEGMTGLDTPQILEILWAAGALAMLLYAVVSYLRVRRRVGESVKLADGVYWCPGLDTAFLFGYFRPRIYLPEMDEEKSRYIRLHEQAHLRHGDHWLMLVGFLALSIHWLNPLVWVAYIFLCRDIEGACDERVIRSLDTQERKEYAGALLAGGRHRSIPVSCPVAFGEVSIKQRVLWVLNYRKPKLWICILLLAAFVGVGVFFLTDPVEYPPYYMELMDSLGDPVTEVHAKLGISNEDVVYDAFEAATPVYVEYNGAVMRLHLSTDQQNRLCAFSYVGVLPGDDPEADETIASLARRLYKLYGSGENAKIGSAPDKYKNITGEEIAQIYKGNSEILPGPTTIGDYWDISQCGHGKLEEYLTEWRRSERFISANVRDYPGDVYANFMVSYHAHYDRDNNQKSFYIRYRGYAFYGENYP